MLMEAKKYYEKVLKAERSTDELRSEARARLDEIKSLKVASD